MCKVIDVMVLYSQEKAELSAYQLKDVTQVLYEKWKEERPVTNGPVIWASFKTTFLNRFFNLELRESKSKNLSIFVNGV